MGFDSRIIAFPKDKDNKEYALQAKEQFLLKTPSYYQEYTYIYTDSLLFHNIVIPYYKEKYKDMRNLADLSGAYFKITRELAGQILNKAKAKANSDVDDYLKDQINAFSSILEEYDLYYQYT